MIRFIEDLGIIPNKGKSFENDPSLKQGQKMMEYGRMYTFFNTSRMKKLENDTYPSKNKKYIESATDYCGSSGNSAVVLKHTISANEQKFYKALYEYSNTSKILEREMVERKDTDHRALRKTLTDQYNDLIAISSVIEQDLDLIQTCSDKELEADFAKRKNDLAVHIKKLKLKQRGGY